jgi:hypothetical protein
MVDGLADLGSPVEDRIFVLNILRGLNQRFKHMCSIIRRYSPFPNFLKVRDDLLLEEIHMDSTGHSAAPTMLDNSATPRQPGHHSPHRLAGQQRPHAFMATPGPYSSPGFLPGQQQLQPLYQQAAPAHSPGWNP